MKPFTYPRGTFVRSILSPLLVASIIALPLPRTAYADVGPCQFFTVSVNNLPQAQFNFTMTVNYTYQVHPSDPVSTDSKTVTVTTNTQYTGNTFESSSGSQVGGTITSVDVFGTNVPADNLPHLVHTGIAGQCDTVVIGPTFPTPPGPCPIVIDIHPGVCP